MLVLLFIVSAAEDCMFFECQDKSRIVPSTFVNDNFCDCPDGSDEPLSSACQNNLFTCPEKIIFSSWVQDGVCDCCDGSDEVQGHCENTCSQFYKSKVEQTQSEFTQWQEGLKIKLEDVVQGTHKIQNLDEVLKGYAKELKILENQIVYLQALKNSLDSVEAESEEIDAKIQELEDLKMKVVEKKEREEKWKGIDLGVQKEFASLLGEKLEKDMGKYVYGIEFFDNAYQKESGMRYSLGNWRGFEDNYSVMKFEGGTGCPNGISRSLKVFLKCSEKLEFVEFKEVSMCTYEATITLPAACKVAFSTQGKFDIDNKMNT